jgi:hypothetical protein
MRYFVSARTHRYSIGTIPDSGTCVRRETSRQSDVVSNPATTSRHVIHRVSPNATARLSPMRNYGSHNAPNHPSTRENPGKTWGPGHFVVVRHASL